MILSSILSIAGHFSSTDRKFDPPLAIHIDEASNVVFAGFDDLLNKGRSAGVMITLYTQSFADFEVAMGKSYLQKMIDNLNIQMFLRVGHLETSQYVAGRAGDVETFSPVLSIGGFSSAREVKKQLLPDNALTRLKPREFVLFNYDRSYFGYVRDVTPACLRLEAPGLEFHRPPEDDEKEYSFTDAEND